MKSLLLSIGILSFFFVFYEENLHAYVIDKTTDRTYEVIEDAIKISEIRTINILQDSWYIPSGSIEGFTIFFPLGDDKDIETKTKKTLGSISIKDSRGATLSYTTEKSSGGNLFVKAVIPNDVTFGNNYSITFEYISYGLMIKSGNLRDVYVPAFAEDYTFENENYRESISTKVKVPKSLGKINFTNPTGVPSSDGVFNIYSFSQEQLIGKTGWIQVGTKQYYSFELKQAYPKTSDLAFAINNYRVILPRNITSVGIKQDVIFTEITPEPNIVERDGNGNIIATFNLPANKEGSITIRGYSIIEQDNTVDITNSGKISDIDKSIIDANTQSAIYWEVDNSEIQRTAKEIIGDSNIEDLSIFEIAQKTYKYVVDKIDYSNVKRFGINERQGALATLRGGAAVCMEYSDLFIALMRANGVPTRAAFGFGYSTLEDVDSGENSVNHQWAEVYFPKLNSWVSVDTTWGENGDTLIGGDLNHFYTHVTSIAPDKPSTTEVKFYGEIKDIPERTTKVEAISAPPQTNGTTEEELLKKYPVKDEVSSRIDSFLNSLSLFVRTTNENINNIIYQFFPNASPEVRLVIKLVGIILIVLIVLIFIRRLKRKK